MLATALPLAWRPAARDYSAFLAPVRPWAGRNLGCRDCYVDRRAWVTALYVTARDTGVAVALTGYCDHHALAWAREQAEATPA